MSAALTINLELLRALGPLAVSRGEAVVRVSEGTNARALHVVRGELTNADSTFSDDRIGQLLAAEGRMDPALVDPMAAAARKAGKMMGDQLIADGVLTGAELAAALERQVLVRAERALVMAGRVSVGPRAPTHAVVHRPLGGLVVSLFREKYALETLSSCVDAVRQAGSRRSQMNDELVATLGLMPLEARILRRLSAGDALADVLKLGGKEEVGLRLLAALWGLGLVT